MEKKINWGIPFIIVCVALCTCICFGVWDHFGADKRYTELLGKHNETVTEVGNLTKKLGDVNTEFEKYKLETDKIIPEVGDTIESIGKVINPLQDVGNEIKIANQGIEESVDGIRKILKEVLAGNN